MIRRSPGDKTYLYEELILLSQLLSYPQVEAWSEIFQAFYWVEMRIFG